MYDSSLPPVLPVPDAQKQSKIGIASFVLGILALVVLCIGLLISVGIGVSLVDTNPYATDPSSMIDQGSSAFLLASAFMYCSPVLSLVGLGLGIAAVIQKKDKKTLGIVGLVINALVVLGFCLLVIFSLMVTAGAMSL